jgi:hypothetical protein
MAPAGRASTSDFNLEALGFQSCQKVWSSRLANVDGHATVDALLGSIRLCHESDRGVVEGRREDLEVKHESSLKDPEKFRAWEKYKATYGYVKGFFVRTYPENRKCCFYV